MSILAVFAILSEYGSELWPNERFDLFQVCNRTHMNLLYYFASCHSFQFIDLSYLYSVFRSTHINKDRRSIIYLYMYNTPIYACILYILHNIHDLDNIHITLKCYIYLFYTDIIYITLKPCIFIVYTTYFITHTLIIYTQHII